MRWFKHMSDMRNDLFIKQLRIEHGNEGYAIWVLLLELYADECGQNPGGFVSFNADVLRKELGISSKKMELFLNYFAENSKLLFNIFGKKLEIKIPKMALLKDNYTKDLQATGKELSPKKQKKEVITNVITEEEENTDRVCVNSDEVFSEPETEPSPLAANAQWHPLAEQGLSHLASLNSPNLQNLAWVKGYLTIKFGEYATNRQDLKPEHLLLCWLDTCDDAVSKNISTPGWFKKVFEAKVDKFSPSNPIKRANALPAAPIHERVMQAETVKYRLDGRYFTGSELKYTKPEGHLEPYYEVKSTGEKLVANFVAIERT